jgi:hypothetical protein
MQFNEPSHLQNERQLLGCFCSILSNFTLRQDI